MAGLAIAALALAGWRKNARAAPPNPRREPRITRPRVPIGIAETVVPLYRRPNPLRRVWAAAASAGLAVVIGAVAAIVIAYGAAWLVVTLTDLLRQ